MNLSQSSWMAELSQSCLETMRRESHVSAAAWEITQDPATAGSLARIAGELYRIVTFESLGGGFSLGLLGADYERVCSDKSWPAALPARLEEEKTRSRYYLATFRPADRAAPLFPLLTLMQDQRGNWHLLETRGSEPECWWMVFTPLVARQGMEDLFFDIDQTKIFHGVLPTGLQVVCRDRRISASPDSRRGSLKSTTGHGSPEPDSSGQQAACLNLSGSLRQIVPASSETAG